jgi:hypothetical protein
MTDRPIILDANAVRALRSGRKTQIRLLSTSPLRTCRSGDRLWVKESCAGGRIPAGEAGEYFSAMRSAEFVVFPDGWRQHRDGRGHPGPVPTSRKLQWTPAIHMPRWALRATLIVESVRIEPLRDIGRTDILAEGQLARFAGLFWRWHKPVRGVWRNSVRAFAAMWNASHGTTGERWEDNPEVIVLDFQVEWPGISGVNQS